MDNISHLKSLYVTFVELTEGDGISKKIKAEFQSLKKCGLNISLASIVVRNGIKYYDIASQEVRLGGRIVARLRFNEIYKSIIKYVETNNVKFVYMRYTFEASANYINFLRKLKELGVTIYLEIPTYPYDGEQRYINPYQVYIIKREGHYRSQLHRNIDKIVTFSSDKKIFGIDCINISNAIDFNAIELRVNRPNHDYVKFIAVATLGFWHGYDRMIKAISEYYKSGGNKQLVYFDIVGDGPAYNDLQNQVNELNVGQYVKFHGKREGTELTAIFNDADICIGSLARHRSGIHELKALKNVEYAVRGVPFIYSEINADFEDKEYIYKVSADESLIDVSKIIEVLRYKEFDAQKIRDSVLHLSWDNQMSIVIDNLKRSTARKITCNY